MGCIIQIFGVLYKMLSVFLYSTPPPPPFYPIDISDAFLERIIEVAEALGMLTIYRLYQLTSCGAITCSNK